MFTNVKSLDLDNISHVIDNSIICKACHIFLLEVYRIHSILSSLRYLLFMANLIVGKCLDWN
jgi:hypothetical protein